MGMMDRFMPKKPKVLSRAPTSKPGVVAGAGAPYESVGDTGDDDPTIFTAYSVVYIGFFGITLLLYPKFHMTGGLPFPNPLAFWTKIPDELEFAFRTVGIAFLTIVFGPFMDDIFGCVGVKMKAFTIQLLLLNVAIFLNFLFYAFYDPLPDAVVATFEYFTYFQGIVVAWNFCEAVADLKKYFVAFICAFFLFFAVGLTVEGSMAFGPSSPLGTTYWTSWPEGAMMTSRSLGLTMIALFGLGYYWIETNALAKQILAANIINFGLFVMPAFFPGKSAVSSMWQIQFAMQITFVLISLYLELTGATGVWSFSFPALTCSLNVELMNFINLCWLGPFCLIFWSVPNYIFGPGTPMGIPMFLTALDETGLWFGYAWATITFILIMGPYLFGTDPVKTLKQVSFTYYCFVVLFTCAYFFYPVMNPMMTIPLTVCNLALGVLGTVAAVGSGQPLL